MPKINNLETYYAKSVDSAIQKLDSDKMTVGDVANIIMDVFDVYYLKPYENTPLDSLLVFNPLTGAYEGGRALWFRLVVSVKAGMSVGSIMSVIENVHAMAGIQGRQLEPYHGSQYLLFLNGVLNVKTMKLIPFNDKQVRDLQFTTRHKISIDWATKPFEPVMADGLVAGGDWTPTKFFKAYADNDDEKLDLLYFSMALGLFSGHNFGMHVNIEGASGWGKSTLARVFVNLFDGRVQRIPYASLNEKFPFTSYDLNTSVIWVSENNVGSEPLNDTYGTIHYDSLGDEEARFQVKGKGDMVVQNPPQVYVDGTQTIKAKNINTGPARRTLVFSLPRVDDNLQAQMYAKDIAAFLKNKSTLQFLVFEFIRVYRKFVPLSRMDDLQLNLAKDDTLALLPSIASEMREKIVGESSSIDTWYLDYVEPYLQKDSMIHDNILYRMYLIWYKQNNPQDNFAKGALSYLEFEKELTQFYEAHQQTREMLGSARARGSRRKRVSDYRGMNFDWDTYESDYGIPQFLSDTNDDFYKRIWGHQISGWYKIVSL